jgi:hypothetical protein
MMKLTVDDMIEARNRANNALTRITDTNTIHEITEQLKSLESVFAEFEKRGRFDADDDQRRVRGGWNVDQKNEDERKDHSDKVFTARVIIARAGLRLLQKAIPSLTQICEQCLEIAGKDAVRAACAPIPREGTDFFGKPCGPMPSEFTLPTGYETLAAKLKTVITG